MTNTQYSIALTVTYVPYIVAELPSNLLLKVRLIICAVTHPMLTCKGCGAQSDAAYHVDTLGSRDYSARYLIMVRYLIRFTDISRGVVTTYQGLLAARFFLGLLEGNQRDFVISSGDGG